MQYTLPFRIENRLLTAHRLLLAAYGPIPDCVRLDPVGQMVFAMLSGRTRDEVAMRTFHHLTAQTGSWQNLMEIPFHEVHKLVADTTFPEKKAKYVPAALKAIRQQRGRLDLDFLGAWPVAEAKSWLETLPGTGAKTSTAVLNFSTLHKRILMVDTAHHRVARRLGLVPEKAGLDRTTRLLNLQIPDDWDADDTETHHVLMQGLGKHVCVHGHPHCTPCPLSGMCPSAALPPAIRPRPAPAPAMGVTEILT